MQRIYVVTGAGSGIGLATAQILRGGGHRVIGIDLRGADISADLATTAGRVATIEQVRSLSGSIVNGLVLAGLRLLLASAVDLRAVSTTRRCAKRVPLYKASGKVAVLPLNVRAKRSSLTGYSGMVIQAPMAKALACASRAAVQ